MPRVLVVDDDPVHLRLTAEIAGRAGFQTLTASGGVEALGLLRTDPGIGAVVLDLVMPDLDGMAVMDEMARSGLTTPVIVQTASSGLDAAIAAMRRGATDFFVKPVAPERLTISLRNALKIDALASAVRAGRNRIKGRLGFADIITMAPAMTRPLALARKAARSTIPVLVEGETGVGKEMIARAIQGSGDRAGKPFVTINCGAIPANLIESTLFGHVKGAFTGAVADQKGKFREAHGGTIFLDEVGELPADAQVRLLRAIQDGEIEPVGATRPTRVNVRIISATNRRLLTLTKMGAFREDLYYRLNVFPIYVPPLRDRPADIAPLVAHFIARLGPETGGRTTTISKQTLDLLSRYDWPGNVRQLENAVYRALVLSETDTLAAADFPQIIARLDGPGQAREIIQTLPAPLPPVHIDAAAGTPGPSSPPPSPAPDRFHDPDGEIKTLAELERDLIVYAISRYDGHMSRVARSLGIGRSTLYRKLRQFGLDGAEAA